MAIINVSDLLKKKTENEQKENNNIEDIIDVWSLEDPLTVYQNKGIDVEKISLYANRICVPIAEKLKQDKDFSECNDTQLVQAAASCNIYKCLHYMSTSADVNINNIIKVFSRYIDPDNIDEDDPLLFETWDELLECMTQLDNTFKNIDKVLDKFIKKKGIKPEEDENQKGDE